MLNRKISSPKKFTNFDIISQHFLIVFDQKNQKLVFQFDMYTGIMKDFQKYWEKGLKGVNGSRRGSFLIKHPVKGPPYILAWS